MKSTSLRGRSKPSWKQKLLLLFNLRPEEGERTAIMFAVYTFNSIGMLWLEQTAIALFLQNFDAEELPIVYIASALTGASLGSLYSWLQNNFPLRRVFFFVAFLMSIPLVLFRITLELDYLAGAIILTTCFVMRLWLDAEELLSDLNTQVAANQLFNIREIKRTYPIISSGLLLGDVLSGFSLPVFIYLFGLKNILLMAAVSITIGASLLFFLSNRYRQAFPDTPVMEEDDLQSEFRTKKSSKAVKKYLIPLYIFFMMAEILYLLVDFQYLGELEFNLQPEQIASFLGIFSGILGVCELTAQWFVAGRAVERLGAFVVAMFLPISLTFLGAGTLLFGNIFNIEGITGARILFFGVIGLKFFDELLRYTLIAGIEPFLFQPLPANIRNKIQAFVNGILEPVTSGITGICMVGGIWLIDKVLRERIVADSVEQLDESLRQYQGGIFIAAIVFFATIWAISAWFLRSSYLNLLVEGAEQGRINFQNVDLKVFRKVILESLENSSTDDDRRSCIQLLERIDPDNMAEIVAPRLTNLSPELQSQCLTAMVRYPNATYVKDVQRLLEQKPPLEVLGLTLRYLWLSEINLDTNNLKPYLQERIDGMIRGTAASLMISRGSPSQQEEARCILEEMLVSPRERERVIATQALQDTNNMDLINQYVPILLQDESPKVRCALLAIIGSKRLHGYYPSLLKALYFKSTREAAQDTLIAMGDDALPLLTELSQNNRKPDFVRQQAWNTIASIETPQAYRDLVNQLTTSWGFARRNLLRVLLRVPLSKGIEFTLDEMGRAGIEELIYQELLMLGHIYHSRLDLNPEILQGVNTELLDTALDGMIKDILERCLLLMKILYPGSAIQAAILNLDCDSAISIALGLEILDNAIDIQQKNLFLEILEGGIPLKRERLKGLEAILPYQAMSPRDRLRHLIDFRHFLSDWTLTCCFHLARSQRWSVTREAALSCLNHPSSFVREAVLAYLKDASPETCLELLPILHNDPNPLVVAQVEKMQTELQSNASS